MQNGSKQFEDLEKYMSSASSATSKFASSLKSIGANIAIMALITLAVKSASAAWDYFNVTVEETQEKIDGINSRISELKSEIEQLDSVQFKTTQQEARLSNLERELDLQEKLLEIEQRRYYQELTGNGFTDQFDENNLNTIYSTQYGDFKRAKYNFGDYSKEIDELEAKIQNASDEEKIKLEEKRNNLITKREDYYASLLEKETEFYNYYLKAKEVVDSGLLTGTSLKKAEESLTKWENAYEEAKNASVEAQKFLGTYNYESEIEGILEKAEFNGIKEQLTDLGEEGLLSDDVLSKRFPKLIEYLKTAGIDTQTLIGYITQIPTPDDINVKTSVEPLSITQTVDQLNTQLKPTIDSLAEAYQNIFTEDGFTRENIGLDMFSSVKEELDNLQKALEESGSSAIVDYSAYEKLVSVLNDADSSAQQIKDAFDEVALSVANVTLTGVEDFEVLRQSLAQLGYVDADLVAFEALVGNMEALKEAGLDLANADLTKTDLVDFVQSLGISAEYASEAVNMLTFAQQLNKANSLDTSTSVADLLQLATDAGYTGEIIQWLTQLMKIYNYLEQDTLKDPQTVQDYIAEAEALTQKIKESAGKINVAPNVDKIDWKPAIKSAEKAGKDAGEAYKDALEEELNNLGDVISYVGDIIGEQIQNIQEQCDNVVESLENERDAIIANLEAEKEALQEQIDAKQAQIDKIREAREQRNAEIDLMRKQFNLERAQNQRTRLVNLCQTL